MSREIETDFIETFIGMPIADVPKERLERIQRWLMLAYRKIEWGVNTGMNSLGKNSLTATQLQMLTTAVWTAVFKVPVFEMLDEKEIAQQLLSQKIRPMTVDDIFKAEEVGNA